MERLLLPVAPPPSSASGEAGSTAGRAADDACADDNADRTSSKCDVHIETSNADGAVGGFFDPAHGGGELLVCDCSGTGDHDAGKPLEWRRCRCVIRGDILTYTCVDARSSALAATASSTVDSGGEQQQQHVFRFGSGFGVRSQDRFAAATATAAAVNDVTPTDGGNGLSGAEAEALANWRHGFAIIGSADENTRSKSSSSSGGGGGGGDRSGSSSTTTFSPYFAAGSCASDGSSGGMAMGTGRRSSQHRPVLLLLAAASKFDKHEWMRAALAAIDEATELQLDGLLMYQQTEPTSLADRIKQRARTVSQVAKATKMRVADRGAKLVKSTGVAVAGGRGGDQIAVVEAVISGPVLASPTPLPSLPRRPDKESLLGRTLESVDDGAGQP